MKHRFFKTLSVIVPAVMLCSSFAPNVVSAKAEETPQSHITEVNVKKSEILSKGAFKAIQSALNAAHYSATKDNLYKIIVEPGSYDLRSALHIYSNTTLSLYNVTLVRNKEALSNMLRTGDDTPADKGATGYSENSNITVEGGTLDGNGTSNTMIKVTHASNFLMTGTEVCNLKNAHMVEAAAVNGFNVLNCSFKNQILDADEVGYEAIQLDIPKDGHIVGCRSEALNMRNVHIEGCYFTNCPRGVGTHTQILNYPFDGIVISHNTFKDIKSVAIQGENWKNVKITNNRIDGAPRGIAFYSILGDCSGGFKASVLAKEGKTSTDISDGYQKPFNANILISDNEITNCGNVKDIYADYEPAAVSIKGKTLTKAGKTLADGSGGYPKGDYYITGVTVKNNKINTGGDAVYLENVRNIAVKSNNITCVKSDYTKKVCNPLTALTVNFSAISGNVINSAPYHGMELAKSTIPEITSNSITGVSLDGIILEAESKVKDGIYDNYITKASRFGINVRPKCAGGTISGNIIYNCGDGGIRQEKNSTSKLGDNYFSVTDMTVLKLNAQSVTLGTEEKFTLTTTYEPVNSVAKFTWSSSEPLVAGVNEKGVVTAYSFGEADITVKSESGKTALCHFKVMPSPSSIKLNAGMLTIGVGETFDLDSRLPEGTVSHSITYTSNHPSAVSVRQSDGLIKGESLGTATIVAKTYNGKHAACNVIVKDAPYDMWFDRAELIMGVGESENLRIVLPDGSASNSVEWKSDNGSAVELGENGVVRAVSEGDAVVTAKAFNGATAVCRVSVRSVPNEVSFAEAEYSLVEGETAQPEIIFPEGTASHALTFQTSDPDICKVNKTTGELTAKKAGTVTLTVKTYNHISATCKVTVG